jgi:glutaconate CoA-transferase subunit B
VDAIVKIPYGAHPYACYRYYDYDPEFLHVYHEKAKSRDTFTEFLDEYVLGVDNWEEYLEKIGGTKKLKKLKANRKLGYNPSLRRRQKKLKKGYAEDYTLFELMTVVSAQEIKDKEIVFAGTGLPMLGAMLAQHTHAPNCVIVFEAGAVDCKLAHLPMSVGDPRTMRLASTATGLFDVFSTVLQNGWIDVGFLSGAQIDRFGNINATAIGDYLHPTVRFTGSGGSGDIACLSKRTVIIARHEKRRFPERVDYITSPGWIDGPDGRDKEGLRWGGPSAVVTTMGVLRFSDDTKTAYLSSYHPKISPQSIQENTGFELDISHAAETEKPTDEEIHILRNVVDPERIFLR